VSDESVGPAGTEIPPVREILGSRPRALTLVDGACHAVVLRNAASFLIRVELRTLIVEPDSIAAVLADTQGRMRAARCVLPHRPFANHCTRGCTRTLLPALDRQVPRN